MALTPWQQFVRLISDGESVNQATANRPLTDLSQQTAYLKQLIDSISSGEGMYYRGVSMASNTLLGHVVYWDAVNNRFAPALAAVDASLGEMVQVASSSYVVGIVVSKRTAVVGDIMLTGILKDFDFTNTTGSASPTPGQWYLSAQTPGTLTQQRPPVGIFVASIFDNTTAHINPTPKDVLDSHIHFKFELYACPASDSVPTLTDNHFTIINPDDALEGWLPADHVSFNGLAPEGALFGYNLAMHPELLRVFPPVPRDSVYIEMNGVDVSENVIVDINGIWWMTDCKGYIPWATHWTPPERGLNPVDDRGFRDTGTCPSVPFYYDSHNVTVTLWFTKMTFKTDTAVVTSLRPAVGSPLRFYNCNGEEATVGDLYAAINLSFEEGSSEEEGDSVFKSFDGFIFNRGHVVERLVAGLNVALTSTRPDGQGGHQGTVTIDASVPSLSTPEGGLELVGLEDVREEVYQSVYFLGMPAGRTSSVRGKVDVPRIGLPSNPKMRIWVWLMATAAGQLPDLDFSHRRLSRPDGCDALPLPQTDILVAAGMAASACGALSGYTYIEVNGPWMSITAGDVLFFSITRKLTSGYAGEVGILRVGYHIESAT